MDFQIIWNMIVEFLIKWGPLIDVLLGIIVFIGTFILIVVKLKRRGLSFSDIIMALLTKEIPAWIRKAEKEGGTSEQKKVSVLNTALNYVSKKLGRKLNEEESSLVITQASDSLEDVLDTPQKKDSENQKEGKKNARYR